MPPSARPSALAAGRTRSVSYSPRGARPYALEGMTLVALTVTGSSHQRCAWERNVRPQCGGPALDELAMTLADREFEHRWLIDPRTGRIALWTENGRTAASTATIRWTWTRLTCWASTRCRRRCAAIWPISPTGSQTSTRGPFLYDVAPWLTSRGPSNTARVHQRCWRPESVRTVRLSPISPRMLRCVSAEGPVTAASRHIGTRRPWPDRASNRPGRYGLSCRSVDLIQGPESS